MNGTVKIDIRDRHGQVTHLEERPMQSPLKAFMQIILMRMGAADVGLVKDTGGTDRTIDQSDTTDMMRADGAAADDDSGIVVGSGTTAVALNDNALGTQIAHGTGAGQLDHQAQSNPDDVATIDPYSEFQIIRGFINSSGGAITITEIGIYAQQYDTTPAARTFCIVRDLVTSGSVPDGGQATVTYTFRIAE